MRQPARRFAFRLAQSLGLLDVNKMLEKMSSRQFVEWQDFYAIEPFGSQAGELHLAAIRAQIANYLRPKNHPGFKTSEFLISHTLPEKPKSVAEIYAILTGAK